MLRRFSLFLERKSLVLHVFLAISFFGFTQNDDELVLQSSLNYDAFLFHIRKQSIMHFDCKHSVRFNENVDTSYRLSFNGSDLAFNPMLTAEQFDFGYDFEFVSLKTSSRNASVIFKYFPCWKSCRLYDSYVVQDHSLFIVVEVKLRKSKGVWVVVDGELSDIVFNSTDQTVICIKEKYIPLE